MSDCLFCRQVRCLGGCRRTVSAPPGGTEPPLCEFCAAEEGKAALVRACCYHWHGPSPHRAAVSQCLAVGAPASMYDSESNKTVGVWPRHCPLEALDMCNYCRCGCS